VVDYTYSEPGSASERNREKGKIKMARTATVADRTNVEEVDDSRENMYTDEDANGYEEEFTDFVRTRSRTESTIPEAILHPSGRLTFNRVASEAFDGVEHVGVGVAKSGVIRLHDSATGLKVQRQEGRVSLSLKPAFRFAEVSLPTEKEVRKLVERDGYIYISRA
jgi:hypothetical protein